MTVDQRAPNVVVPPLPPSPGTGHRGTTLLFATTAFLGAGLLFLVEPLVAKLVLPDYGGSATVWSTCTLFFQTLLLLAYGYCHLSTARLRRRWQPRAHLLVLLLPVLALPLAVPADAAPALGTLPMLWLLRTLAVLVGLPFVVVATTGPLLQKWYSWTTSSRADDPYFLFAASNLGSFVGLLAYPLWVEPSFTLADQRLFWSLAYGAFLLLTGACAVVAGRRRPLDHVVVPAAPQGSRAPRPAARRMLGWTALAMLPSSLMLGVTAHLSTDVASIPLLWVVPLALYLGSFVFAFARTSRSVPVRATRLAVALGLLEVVTALSGPLLPIYVSVTTSLLMLAAVAFAAHARLAVDRPEPQHLTLFYMLVATGGALGGLLNGFLAPAVFSSVVEYPIALSAVPLLLLGVRSPRGSRLARWIRANLVRTVCVVIVTLLAAIAVRAGIAEGGGGLPVALALLVGTVALGAAVAQHPPLAVATVLFLYGTNVVLGATGVVEQTRTFYGTYRVFSGDGHHTFVHGTTVHGTQFTDPRRRGLPTTYYSRRGPLGDVFSVANAHGLGSVGAVGLGSGTLAAYGREGQRFTFYEIDPEVVRIAENPRYFTYLRDSAATVRTVTGDGRLRLSEAAPGSFDLIVLDAFSSDAIPVHLLTEEAVRTYASRLRPGGMLAFHISNRVFDLEPVLDSAAQRLGWTAVVGEGGGTADGATPSRWVVLGRPGGAVRDLSLRPLWSSSSRTAVTWTDDYSSVLSVLK